MYKIIGGDQKQYGPVSAEQVQQWIAEGRAGAQTKAQTADSSDWQPLSAFPEFADALAAQSTAQPPPVAEAATPAPLSPDAFAHDYRLDIGTCVSNGWNLFKNNFSLLFLGVLIYLLIEGAIAALGAIPIVGPLFSLGNLFVVGPLMGGVFYLFLQAMRQRPASVGDVFAGFRMQYLQLILGQLVSGLLAGLCIVPGILVAVFVLLPSIMHQQAPGVVQIVIAAVVVLASLIPMIYLQVCWAFTLPLVIDKRMDFWPAMHISRKMVGRHWWQVFGFFIVCGLLYLVGVLAGLVVGVLAGGIAGTAVNQVAGIIIGCAAGGLIAVTYGLLVMPVVFGAKMYAYETIFSLNRAQAP